jgi:two-component system, chemotaxis family, response regulator Rcp1
MSSFPVDRQAVVLLVEDNEDDVEIMRLGLNQAGLTVQVHHVPDGEECMLFLRSEGRYANAPAVDLVLLDMNMPRMDGREVLESVGADDTLKHLPIVVMTSSTAAHDVLDAYRLRCSSYIVKPIEFERFVAIIRSIADYWLTTVMLPSRALRGVPASPTFKEHGSRLEEGMRTQRHY